jgi:glycosyltransferase involved in cell wall biosynthesis
MQLSIIIPVYNVEAYVAKCLDSVFSQGMDSSLYEVIIINDGSPDNSKAIIESYLPKHSNLIFIDQENQGVSVARNKGLEIAKGNYIAFIDPDDTIEPNSLLPILNKAFELNIDLLYLDLKSYNEVGELLYVYEKVGEDDIVSDGFSHPRRTFPATLYKRSTIGGGRFVKGIIRGQDTVFNAMVQAKANRCSYCSIPYYRYTQRGTSSRRLVYSDAAYDGFLLAIEKLDDFKKKEFPFSTTVQNDYFEQVISIFITRLFEHSILPTLQRSRYYRLQRVLKSRQLTHLVYPLHVKFPYAHQGYWKMALFHKYLQLKSYVYRWFFPKRTNQ